MKRVFWVSVWLGAACSPVEILRPAEVCEGGSPTPCSDPTGNESFTWAYTSPTFPARAHHAMAFDVARQRVVLFGGEDLDDTWEWDGQNWEQRKPTHTPPGRFDGAMAWDALRQKTVLHGGKGGFHSPDDVFKDTWEWDGTDWVQLNLVHPVSHFGGALAYDEARQNLVFFGGSTDTWVLQSLRP